MHATLEEILQEAMKRSRKTGTADKATHESDDEEGDSLNEASADGESKASKPNLTLLSALNAPGSSSPQMRLLAQIGALPTGNLPLGARFAPPLGFDPNSLLLAGQGSGLWGQQHQEMEQQRQQLLRAQILLQQQQQEQALLAAVASSGAGSLPSMANNLGASHHLATLGSTLAARAQLEKAHAQLRSQAMLSQNAFGSNEGQTALSSMVRPQDLAPTPATKRDDKLPYYYDAPQQPDPPSDGEPDEEENQGSGSELPSDPSAAAQEKFPLKLYRMLDEAGANGDDSIVSFFPHGRAFAIHKPREFVSELMPKYFSTSRMSSFQRQLNLYGFRRITDGRDKGGYFHEHFLRGRKGLVKKIHRKKTILRAPPETSERAPEGILESPFAAASTSGLNPAFLAQLSQQNLLQRQHFAAAMQHLPQSQASMAMPNANNPLLGVGNLFGGLQLPPGFGGSAQTGGLSEAGLFASEMASIDRHRSDLLRQLLLVQQQQRSYGSTQHETANEKGDRSDSSDR